MTAIEAAAGESVGRAARRTSAGPRPADRLLGLINAAWTTQLLCTACRLQLPARLGEAGAAGVAAGALAAATGCNAAALGRLLRALVAVGVCDVDGARRYRLTAMGALLQADHPDSLHHWALHAGSTLWRRLGELPESIRTGGSEPQRRHLADGYADLSFDPGARAVFDRSMVELTRQALRHVLPAIDRTAGELVVDVGGGGGELLGAVLAQRPTARGLLFDQPAALQDAAWVLARAGVADRCEQISGDFFVAVPDGGDIYLLKSVLHNWDDARCGQILRNCRRAMVESSRLLIIERVLPDMPRRGQRLREAARTDLNMLVSLTGRERSAAEYALLLDGAGLRLVKARTTQSEWSVLEARHA